MNVMLSITTDQDHSGPEDLAEWLRHEPGLRGHVTPMYRQPQPGELGTVLDVLSVAVGSGGALSILASSLRTFLAQPRRANVRITIRTPDGGSVVIDAKRVADVEAVLRNALGEVD